MRSPRMVREVQQLTGRVAALSRFLAKSAGEALSFFKALKGTKSRDFQWSDDCEEAFQGLKSYLSSSPLLASPQHGEELYLYLFQDSRGRRDQISPHGEGGLSTGLFREEAQAVLSGAQNSSPDGPATKGHLAETRDLRSADQGVCLDLARGRLLREGLLRSRDRLAHTRGIRDKVLANSGFSATNNVAKYEALLAGLQLAKECSAKELIIYSDSELVINRSHGSFASTTRRFVRYLLKVKGMIVGFKTAEFIHIPREENAKADTLARAAASGDPEQYARGMREVLGRRSIEDPEQ
ncbi:hypothetical protein Nepgr_018041 [Nepenthes gracilis]|uniref:RNase H type-1 domain-containing protein n=1 Tax=Nepenthes gracilis TaxID=150966 RepID=A0AAD3XTY8_NEPGR|nr:hypothetical protein Nepgr_018041 [Nepenthes gracilis]